MLRKSVAILSAVIVILLTQTSPTVAGTCGDINNDGTVDISDLTYFVSYMFDGGPPPNCGEEGTVTDIDGNVYQTVTIGTQVWMMENLKVTHYRNGDPIPNVTDKTTWHFLTTGAYCDYYNDPANVDTYGRLYNWYAVDDSRNIAPAGWHVATDEEWKQLEIYLGMSQAEADAEGWRGTDEGGKLKEAGTTHWASPNTGATNAGGFTALPSGCRINGDFAYMGNNAYFWSSTEYDSNVAWYRFLSYEYSQIHHSITLDKRNGFSVRCVRDY